MIAPEGQTSPHLPRLVVHVGLPKTGTSFLQKRAFPGVPDIAAFGKTPGYQLARPDMHWALQALSHLPADQFEPHAPQVREVLLQELDAARARVPRPACCLLSYEGLYHPNSIHPLEVHARLQSIFGDFNILLTIRRQVDWITSCYLYRFRRLSAGGAPSFEQWTERARSRPCWNAFTCADYWAVIDPLVQRVGRGRVLVEPLEGWLGGLDGGADVRVATFLGVDPTEFGRQCHESPPLKQRIDELGFLFGRLLYEGRDALTPEQTITVKGALQQAHARLKDGYAPAHVPGEHVERLFTERERQALHHGNAQIAAMFGLDLAALGYL